MSQNISNAKIVVRLSCWQAIFTILFAFGMFVFVGKHEAVSALMGGFICSLANLFFAGRLFSSQSEQPPKQMLRRFYRSEALKIVFTLTMFIIAMSIAKVALLPFIVSYLLAALIVNWLFLLWA